MFEVYTHIINDYTEAFNQYNCVLKVECGWSNFLKKNNSSQRLSFVNGYSCYIYCNVERDGKVVRYEDKDGEVDYYELSAYWSISSISKFFFHLNVCLYEETTDINVEMNRLLKIIATL